MGGTPILTNSVSRFVTGGGSGNYLPGMSYAYGGSTPLKKVPESVVTRGCTLVPAVRDRYRKAWRGCT